MKLFIFSAALAAMPLVTDIQSGSPAVTDLALTTNGRIQCTHQDLPTFTSDHAGKVFGFPYDGGPNQTYGTGDKQTAAWSYASATSSERNSDRGLTQKVVIKNRLGGQSGGFGKGGHGEAEPQFSETLKLPAGRSWDISLTAVATGAGISNPDGGEPLAPVTIRIIRGTEAKVVTVQRDAEPVELTWDGAPAGEFRIEMDSARFVRGSYGGKIGQRDEGTASASLILKVTPR